MKDKEKILQELEIKFEELKKKLNLKINFEEFDSIFSISDGVLFDGFVGKKFSRQICSKISERFVNWANYLNSLILPNSGSLPNQTEAKLFSSEEDKRKIWGIIKNLMKFNSMNSLIAIKKDTSLEKDFIDGSCKFWVDEFVPFIEDILERIYNAWKE